ncbi:40S small subunit processome assembly factor 1 [Anarhichas minor]|uniref:40S small subunit processome assembly factor 1 n=1 Tax=Anarhichas minor TaxID=65739 RepID=UPI003F7376EB
MNGKEDGDCLSLEHVLDQLYEFDDGPASKKKLKSQKKKKRKRYEEEEEEVFPAAEDICSDSEDKRVDHVGAEHQQQQPKTEQTGPTIQQVSQVKVVIFQDPRKKQKTKQTTAPDKMPAPQKMTEEEESGQLEELNLEKTRLEVHRFGITGYKKEQQRVFEQDRAVMLGARPPKKDYVNYKMMQQQIKEKKQKAKEVQPDLKKKKKPSNQRAKKKKVSSTSGSGSAPTGQVGHFKNGMLILSPKEIQKIKGNKRRK